MPPDCRRALGAVTLKKGRAPAARPYSCVEMQTVIAFPRLPPYARRSSEMNVLNHNKGRRPHVE